MNSRRGKTVRREHSVVSFAGLHCEEVCCLQALRLEVTTYSLWITRRFYWVEGQKGQPLIGRG